MGRGKGSTKHGKHHRPRAQRRAWFTAFHILRMRLTKFSEKTKRRMREKK